MEPGCIMGRRQVELVGDLAGPVSATAAAGQSGSLHHHLLTTPSCVYTVFA